MFDKNIPNPLLMLINIIIQANRPVNTARLLAQLGELFLALSQALRSLFAPALFGNSLGRLSLAIARLRIAATRRQEPTARTSIGGGSHVYRIRALDIVDVEVGAVGGEQNQNG